MVSRAYCFTLFKLDELDEQDYPEIVRYCIHQLEKCPESGRLHYQGYVELAKPVRITQLKQWLPTANFQARRGTREEARAYCSKEESREEGPWEYGQWEKGGQGTRTDLGQVKRRLDEGASEVEIADEFFSIWARNFKAFREYKRIKTKPRDFATENIVIIGPPGVGKSRMAHSDSPDYYSKDGSQWWDGYQGNPVVIFDDFKGCYPYTELTKVMDRYGYQVQFKGGYHQFVTPKIYFTSNYMPDTWYDTTKYNFDAFKRRVYAWIYIPERGAEPFITEDWDEFKCHVASTTFRG